MRINVHIERLILEGLPVTSLQGPQVALGLEGELARLLAANGLAPELRGGIAIPQVRAGHLQLSNESEPAKLGRDVARAVHEGIGSCGAGILLAENNAGWKPAPQSVTSPRRSGQ